MKKSILLACAAAAAFIMTGCTSVHTNDSADATKPRILTREFKPEIEVRQAKVSGEASINSLFWIINWGVSEFADEAFVSTSLPISFGGGQTVAKQGATYKACERAKADYILGAKYRIEIKDYVVFKQIKCRVTGFPGYLKSVK